MNGITLRSAVASDLADLALLQEESFPPSLRDGVGAIERCIREALYLVAEDGGRVVGAVIGLLSKDELHVYAVEVLRAWRGRGVGGSLLRGLIARAAGRRVTAAPATEGGARLLRRFPEIEIVALNLDRLAL